MPHYCAICGIPFSDGRPEDVACSTHRETTDWIAELAADSAWLQDHPKGKQSPFAVAVDTREQAPYQFQGITCDTRQGRKPLVVTRCPCPMPTGDYSIQGYVDQVCVERKSYSDLCGTLTGGRDRFVRELSRMAAMTVSWVVCEVDYAGMMSGPPAFSQTHPKMLWRSIWAFNVRFPTVHWVMCPGREVAEVTTYRLLERWWVEMVGRPATAKKVLPAGNA